MTKDLISYQSFLEKLQPDNDWMQFYYMKKQCDDISVHDSGYDLDVKINWYESVAVFNVKDATTWTPVSI